MDSLNNDFKEMFTFTFTVRIYYIKCKKNISFHFVSEAIILGIINIMVRIISQLKHNVLKTDVIFIYISKVTYVRNNLVQCVQEVLSICTL